MIIHSAPPSGRLDSVRTAPTLEVVDDEQVYDLAEPTEVVSDDHAAFGIAELIKEYTPAEIFGDPPPELAEPLPPNWADLPWRHNHQQQPDGEGALDPAAVHPLIDRFRAVLKRRGDNSDPVTVSLAAQLGDLLAASGATTEALVTYREILDQLRDSTTVAQGAAREAARLVARHASAVIDSAGLKPSSPVVAALRELIPVGLAAQPDSDHGDQVDRDDEDDQRAVLEQLRSTAAQTVTGVGDFDRDAADRLRVTPAPGTARTVEELEPAALTNAAAARLQLAESTTLTGLLPVSVLSEAVLDSGLVFSSIARWRGERHPMRFADHLIIEGTLPESASYKQQVAAVLRAPLRTRTQVRVGEVVYYTGSTPETSEALLKQWRQQYHLTNRHVVINCPHLLRARSDNDGLNPGNAGLNPGNTRVPATHDQLSGVVVTSLLWGGAADVGALVARDWGWGFAAATRTRLEGHPETTFGAWTDSLGGTRKRTRPDSDLSATSEAMLDALPQLSHRVYALDQPEGALSALTGLPRLGRPGNPLPIVLITMGDRRIQWVARHMLSHGGRHRVGEKAIQAKAEELHALQTDLVRAAQGCNSPTTPALILELTDHLDDGYAELGDNDPVDADFDCFADTADRIRAALEALAAGHSPLTMARESARLRS